MAGFGQSPPFTNDEKNFLLAEIIKAAAPPHVMLLQLCNQLNIQPRLEDVPLPPGRSLNACKLAFEEMRRAPQYSPMSQVGTPLSAPVPSLKRHTGMEGAYSANRPIYPKTSGYQNPISIAEPPLKRKRGRPTKAEQQARAAEQMGESSSGARFQTPLSASMPPSPMAESRPLSAALPPVSRMPISAIVSTPVAAPKSASHSGSSSGKRRRRRRSDERPDSGPPRFGSPAMDESPARSSTAARRRDEHIHSSMTGLRVSEPEQRPGAAMPPTSASPRPYGGLS